MRHIRLIGLLAAVATIGFACSSSDSGSNNGGLGGSAGGGGLGGLGGQNGTGSTATGNATGSGATAGFGGQGGAGGNTGIGGFGLDGGFTYGTTQCSDGIDNADGDSLIDSADPECISPLDNDESSYATGIPGDNSDPFWQDCFFDGNSGAGDDKCRYHTDCLTGAKPLTDPDCTVTQACRDFCQKYTPNGCDCFGCCAVTGTDGGTRTITLAATCDLGSIDDPTKCPPCTITQTCGNTCGHCELCIGKDTLPADCTPTGTGGAGAGGGSGSGGGTSCVAPICDPGIAPCGVSCLPNCGPGTYCTTGCCVEVIN